MNTTFTHRVERGESCLNLSQFTHIRRFVAGKNLRSQSISETRSVCPQRASDLYVWHKIGPRLSQCVLQRCADTYNSISDAIKRLPNELFKKFVGQSSIMESCDSYDLVKKLKEGKLYSRKSGMRIADAKNLAVNAISAEERQISATIPTNVGLQEVPEENNSLSADYSLSSDQDFHSARSSSVSSYNSVF